MFRYCILILSCAVAFTATAANADLVNSNNAAAFENANNLSPRTGVTIDDIDAIGPDAGGALVVGAARKNLSAESLPTRQNPLRGFLQGNGFTGHGIKTNAKQPPFVPNLGTGRLTGAGSLGQISQPKSSVGASHAFSGKRSTPAWKPNYTKVIPGGDDWTFSNRGRFRTLRTNKIDAASTAEADSELVVNPYQARDRECILYRSASGSAGSGGKDSGNMLISFIDGLVSQIGSVFNCLL